MSGFPIPAEIRQALIESARKGIALYARPINLLEMFARMERLGKSVGDFDPNVWQRLAVLERLSLRLTGKPLDELG